MIESMSLTVAPWDEQGAINDFQAFGWHLSTSQEVYDNSVKFERRYGDLYQVTSTTNYVKLLFQRDKNMPNYAKICEFEELYFNAKKVMGYNSVSIIPGKI